MSTVVSFAAFKNARRANDQIAKHESAKAERRAEEKAAHAAEVAASLGNGPAAQILGSLVAEVAIEQKESAEASRYMPAYCDPKNEVRGSKYDATKGLGSADLAARIRQDIKDAQKRGEIAKGFKISVRKDSYSGGYSIDVRITAVPEGFKLYSDRFASWCKQFPGYEWKCPLMAKDQRTEEYHSLIEKLRTMHAAYNRDNSDSMVDYFDTRYYGDVAIHWELESALRKAEVAAADGYHWVEDACR